MTDTHILKDTNLDWKANRCVYFALHDVENLFQQIDNSEEISQENVDFRIVLNKQSKVW
jgi:hypothetical protein